ncbi:MAG: group II intron maturase-specific domain-containing protein, partial [Candidatus Methylomirabilales bacterium]
PKRLAKFGLEVAPEKTRLLRFSRFHPGMRRRFAFLGFEFYWSVDRQGERRLMKRTARKKLGRALKAFSDWVRTHRHLPTKELFRQVAWKLRGHFNYFGLPGNSRSITEFHAKVLETLLKWLKRRNRRHRMNGWRFYRLVELLRLPEPRIVPYPRTRSIVLA